MGLGHTPLQQGHADTEHERQRSAEVDPGARGDIDVIQVGSAGPDLGGWVLRSEPRIMMFEREFMTSGEGRRLAAELLNAADELDRLTD